MTRVPAQMVSFGYTQGKLQAQDGGGDTMWFMREIRVRELTQEKHVQWSKAGGTVVVRRVKRLWAVAGFRS